MRNCRASPVPLPVSGTGARVTTRAEAMRGATTSAGNEGLTDHSTRDLDGPRPAPMPAGMHNGARLWKGR